MIPFPSRVTVDKSMRRAPFSAALLLLAAGCVSRQPNDLVILDVPGAPRYAVSTEDGILALSADDLAVDALPILHWHGGDAIRDEAVVRHRSAGFGLLAPTSARIEYATFAAVDPLPGESLWIQVLEDDPERRPALVEASLFEDGARGDLLAIDEWFWSPDEVAADWVGAGVYVRRKGAYELVGVVNGLVADHPAPTTLSRWFGPRALVAFAGLDAIAPTLPESSDYFSRRIRAFRPDFEHGLERDGSERRRENP